MHLLGINSVTINREAVAEFVGAVPMGSPENKLGNDPETGYTDPQFWLNIAGRDARKVAGDRYSSGVCEAGVAYCTGTQVPGVGNDEYNQDGYFYAIDVKKVEGGKPLLIEAFDAAMVDLGSTCKYNYLTPEELWWLTWDYPDAETRYAPGVGDWCTGDSTSNGGNGVKTTFIVREPDDTPWTDTDNPVVKGCDPLQTPSWAPDDPGEPRLFELLDNFDGVLDEEAVMDPNDGKITFVEYFRRWVPICEIPAGQVKKGKYIIQVRTAASSSKPLEYDPTENEGGATSTRSVSASAPRASRRPTAPACRSTRRVACRSTPTPTRPAPSSS